MLLQLALSRCYGLALIYYQERMILGDVGADFAFRPLKLAGFAFFLIVVKLIQNQRISAAKSVTTYKSQKEGFLLGLFIIRS